MIDKFTPLQRWLIDKAQIGKSRLENIKMDLPPNLVLTDRLVDIEIINMLMLF